MTFQLLRKANSSLAFLISSSQFSFKSRVAQFTHSSSSTPVELAYDLSDKYESPNALVIVHGLYGSKQNWKTLSKRINETTKQKVYSVDMRNHADSFPYTETMSYADMASDLNHFIKKIAIRAHKCDSITLMGHSMGGKAAMTLALLHPELIDKLIVADIAPSSTKAVNQQNQAFVDAMSRIDLDSLDPAKLTLARRIVDEHLCQLQALKNDKPTRMYLTSRLTVSPTSGKVAWNFNINAIRAQMDEIMSFPKFETTFEKPTLFMAGERSNYIEEKDKPLIEGFFPNYSLKTIAKAGHIIHFDNPTDTISSIDNFVNHS